MGGTSIHGQALALTDLDVQKDCGMELGDEEMYVCASASMSERHRVWKQGHACACEEDKVHVKGRVTPDTSAEVNVLSCVLADVTQAVQVSSCDSANNSRDSSSPPLPPGEDDTDNRQHSGCITCSGKVCGNCGAAQHSSAYTAGQANDLDIPPRGGGGGGGL